MIRSGTFFDGSKRFILFSEEYKKSEPFSYWKKVRILLMWCTSRDSNPGPTDQEKPTCNNRQFSKLRQFVILSFYRKFVFCICCILCSRYSLLHPLSSRSGVQKCAKMCKAKINHLKQALGFYTKPGKRSGSSLKRQLRYYLFRPSIKCTSTTTIHGRDLDNCDLL